MFFVLYTLLIPGEIIYPAVIIVLILTLGLVIYYYRILIIKTNKSSQKPDITLDHYLEDNKNNGPPCRLFILVYVISISIVALGSNTSRELFLTWEQIDLLQIVQLIAAISLSFIIPGYAIIRILDGEKRLGLLPKLLLSYLFSISVTGLTSYVPSSLGFDFLVTRTFLIVVYVCILAMFVILTQRKYRSSLSGKNILNSFAPFFLRSSPKNRLRHFKTSLQKHSGQTLVFASLLAFVILSTYYVYGGTIIGDQWFHHGRALSFISGTFRSAALLDENLDDPPFTPAFLAGFFSLSGVPTVNAYAAISFLNVIPVFAFYYFFSRWVPRQKSNAAILASVLFALSSGFGWIYLLYLSDNVMMTSEQDSLNIFNDARIKSFDIFQPSSFVIVENPSITSPLIIISLPAGLVLLGLIVEGRNFTGSKIGKISYLVIITIVSLVGGITHTEFYLFVLVSVVLTLVFGLKGRDPIFIALLLSVFLTLLADVLPGNYFTAIRILGIPVTYLVLVFTAVIWALSHLRTSVSPHFSRRIPTAIVQFVQNANVKGRRFFGRSTRITLLIILVSIIAYVYIFAFVVWGELSSQDVMLQTSRNGQQEIPWYLYPMKLGLCGLLGLSYVISYLYRPFEKRIFVFGILIVMAFITGPYYDEHRFSKYMMIGFVGFAAILVYDILSIASVNRKPKVKEKKLSLVFLSLITSLVVVSAGLSVILYTGYGALAMANHYPPFEKDSPKRHFPSLSEINMFKFLFNDIVRSKKNYNIITSPDEYNIRQDGFAGKLEAFVGIPTTKLLQGQDVLKTTSAEQFYDMLNNTKAKYIIIKNDDILSRNNYTENGKKGNGQTDVGSFEPSRFAFKNFPTVYQDNNYTVLLVPDNLVNLTQDTDNIKSIENPDKSQDNEKTSMKFDELIKIPGDLSDRAKQRGSEVHWQKAIVSTTGIYVAVLISITAGIIGKNMLWPPRRKN